MGENFGNILFCQTIKNAEFYIWQIHSYQKNEKKVYEFFLNVILSVFSKKN
jgi:hypothetical protein